MPVHPRQHPVGFDSRRCSCGGSQGHHSKLSALRGTAPDTICTSRRWGQTGSSLLPQTE